jgi:hypothetical protein
MRIRATKYTLIVMLAALSAGFFSSCKKKAPPPPPPPPPVVKAPEPVQEAPKEKPVYVYSGDRFRDPFTPTGLSTSYQPDAVFDPQRATVKGLIFGTKMQSAVLQVGGTGTYFVRSGRIFDIMGKNVEGYSAKIFKDKVSITGEGDTVYELKLQNPEEGKAL